MKIIGLRGAKLETCIRDAQRERVVLTRNGKPVAVVMGVEGLDLDQVQLGHSDAFWTMIGERRKQKTLTKAQLQNRLRGAPHRSPKTRGQSLLSRHTPPQGREP